MKIVNHKIYGIEYREANSFSPSIIKPELIVMHDTAGRLDKGNSVDWFQHPDCNVSAHFIIERDGEIVQCVPCNQRAYHAGKSQWRGRSDCNGWSIGVELVNPGLLDKDGKAWFHKGNQKGFPTAGLKRALVPNTKDRYALWMPYTQEQIEASINLCRTLVGVYGITDITTHWAIRPGDKVDTCPLFPLEELRRTCLKKPTSIPVAKAGVNGAAGVAAAAAEAADEPLPAVAALVEPAHGMEPEPEAGERKKSWFTSNQMYEINEMVEQGSRLGRALLSGPRRIVQAILALFGVGGSAYMAVDPGKGAPAVAEQALRPFPVLWVILCTVLITAVVFGGLGWWYLKRAQNGAVSAKRDGRYIAPAAPREPV